MICGVLVVGCEWKRKVTWRCDGCAIVAQDHGRKNAYAILAGQRPITTRKVDRFLGL